MGSKSILSNRHMLDWDGIKWVKRGQMGKKGPKRLDQ